MWRPIAQQTEHIAQVGLSFNVVCATAVEQEAKAALAPDRLRCPTSAICDYRRAWQFGRFTRATLNTGLGPKTLNARFIVDRHAIPSGRSRQ